jgi:hypothetical protein
VDVVVSPVDSERAARLAERHDARLAGPAALADLLLYGVSRGDADELAVRCLGTRPSAPFGTADSAPGSNPGRQDRGPTALVTLAAVVGVVCLVLAAVVAGVWTPDEFGVDVGSGARSDAAAPGASDVDVGTDRTITGTTPEPAGSTDADADAALAESESYPPGVAADAVDVEVLSAAHAAAVDGRSYRLLIRQSGTDALDGARRWDGMWQHTVVGGDGTWLSSVVGYVAAGNDSRLVQYTDYADGESVFRRADTREGPVSDRFPIRSAGDGGPHVDRARRALLRYLDTTATRVDRPSWDPSVYRVVATGRPLSIDGAVSNYTATAIVAEDGFVSMLAVEYTRLEGDETRTVRFRLEYAAVDGTEVRPPGWYDQAVAPTPENGTATG